MNNPFEPYKLQFSAEERKQLIAKTLKELRIANKIQQKELCQILDIPATTYNGYEKGRTEPPIEILVRLSFYYGVDMNFITQRNFFFKNEIDALEAIEEYRIKLEQQKEEIKNRKLDSTPESKEMFETMNKLIDAMKRIAPSIYTPKENTEK